MEEGIVVTMMVGDEEIYGITIENESSVIDSTNRVIRVRWDDGSESIENVYDLY